MRMLPSSLLISLLVVEVEAKSLNEAMAKIKIDMNGAAALNCTPDRVSYAVGSLLQPEEQSWLEDYKRALPRVHIMKAVSGYNQTEAIAELLDSGLKFHNLSKDGRKWGKLATFLTKFKLILFQVERHLPFQVTLESDLEVQPTWGEYIQRICDTYNREPGIHALRCSNYAECFMTSLDGARHMMRTIQQRGIYLNDDQQLWDPAYFRTKYVFQPRPKPFQLRRKTNSGDIRSTRVISLAETALLRLVTNPAARRMPLFGNADFTEFGVSPFFSEPMRKRRANERAQWKARSPSVRKRQKMRKSKQASTRGEVTVSSHSHSPKSGVEHSGKTPGLSLAVSKGR
jgi:hypothetical protein